MKRWLIMLAILAGYCGVAKAQGDGADNGGDHLSLEFTSLAREVHFALKAHPGLLDDEQMQAFDTAIRSTRVDDVRGPIFDEQNRQVDARVIYDEQYKELVIEIDRTTWPDIITRRVSAHKLAFHEYLRVIGVDDDNYVVSVLLTADPYARFLSIQAPTLRGTHLWEQLRDYYAVTSAPAWDALVDKGELVGRCFQQGNDVGLARKIYFYERSNGSILEPSRVARFNDWHTFFDTWDDQFQERVLLASENELKTQAGDFAVRIYGDVVLLRHVNQYCFAEQRRP